MLQKLGDEVLAVLNLFFVFNLLLFEFLLELINLLLFLVKDFVLLLISLISRGVFLEVVTDFVDVRSVCFHHFPHLSYFFVHLFQLGIV